MYKTAFGGCFFIVFGGKIMKNGKVYMYYGKGRGKTTLAIGQGLRAVGDGKKVVMIQFLDYNKNKDYSYLKTMEPLFRAFRFEKEREKISKDDEKELKNEIVTAVTFARKIFETDESNVVILDGVLEAVSKGFITDEELLELLKKRGHADVIITGTEKCEKTAEYADNIYSINIEK